MVKCALLFSQFFSFLFDQNIKFGGENRLEIKGGGGYHAFSEQKGGYCPPPKQISKGGGEGLQPRSPKRISASGEIRVKTCS